MVNERNPAQIGAWLRRRRLSAGLKQDQVPGVSSATVRKIENGTEPNPRPRTRLAIARGLGLEDDAYSVLASGGLPALADRPWVTDPVEEQASDNAWHRMNDAEAAEYRALRDWVGTLPMDQQARIDTYAFLRSVQFRIALMEELHLRMPEAAKEFLRLSNAVHRPTEEQFALAADTGNESAEAGPSQKRPSPDIEPEGT